MVFRQNISNLKCDTISTRQGFIKLVLPKPVRYNFMKIKWTLVLYQLIRFIWSDLRTASTFISHTLSYYNHVRALNSDRTSRRTMYSRIHKTFQLGQSRSPLTKTPLTFTNSNTSLVVTRSYDKMIDLFKVFIVTNTFIPHSSVRLHPSWLGFYIFDSGHGTQHISISKFFTKWKLLYHFLFNIFYFNINILFFGNTFFKEEINAFNWILLGRRPGQFRYVLNFLMLKPSRIFNQGWVIFSYLRSLHFNMACVIDIMYHKKTVYYLRRTGFFTVGAVPVNYNQMLVDLALPTSSDSYSTQFFMLTFIRNLKKTSETVKYKLMRQLWKGFYDHL